MKIVLGVFSGDSYIELQTRGYLGFFEFGRKDDFTKVHKEEDFFERAIIRYAKENSIEIGFSLDYLRYPHNKRSVSCDELAELLKDQEALDKTEFYQNCQKVDKKEVLDFLEKNFFDFSVPIQPLPLFQVCQLPEEIYY